MKGQPLEVRFWDKVDSSSPDGCWPWVGSYRHAYGEFWVDGRKRYAHRVSAAMKYGPLGSGVVVRHKCDNPRCVRPDHLELGTQVDNVRDMARRRRWRNQFASGDNNEKAPERGKYLPKRVPIEPLAEHLGCSTGYAMASAITGLGPGDRPSYDPEHRNLRQHINVARRNGNGLTTNIARRICDRIGVAPSAIWPSEHAALIEGGTAYPERKKLAKGRAS